MRLKIESKGTTKDQTQHNGRIDPEMNSRSGEWFEREHWGLWEEVGALVMGMS